MVHRLFDAMRAADGPAAGTLFHPDARLESVGRREGQVVLRGDPIAAFVGAVGTPRTEVWDEKIWDLEVRVDGDLATAWMNYAFYVDDRFSHCGVNAFTFLRSEGGWKILHIIDTRHPSGCEPPQLRK